VKIERPTIDLPTTRYLREQVRRLLGSLPGARVGEDEPIHQIRVASRRIRVALPVVARKPVGRRVRLALKDLRALTRLAGQSRDLDVCAAVFDEAAPGPHLTDSALRLLHARLQSARTHAHRGLVRSLTAFTAAGLLANLDGIVRRGGVTTSEARLMLAMTARRQAQAARTELRALGRRYDAIALHAFRRRARRLRYLAEIDRALLGGTATTIGKLKDLQEVLGHTHDVSMLAQWIEPVAAAWEAQGKAKPAATARALQASLHARAHELHRRFLAARPAGILRQVLRRTATLLRSVRA
jgi:CHAD domain-containing protein